MLKASELRIGNWIADRGLKEWQIDHWETMNKVSAKPNTMMCGGILTETHPLTEYVDYLKPIRISEKWLLNFGFKREGEIFTVSNFPFSILCENPDLTSDIWFLYLEFYGGDKFEKPIEYVHQLQNLYFALVGIELVFQD